MFQKKQPRIPHDDCGSSGTKQPFKTQVDWKVFQQEAAGAGAGGPALLSPILSPQNGQPGVQCGRLGFLVRHRGPGAIEL
jgi:hypothetical protein